MERKCTWLIEGKWKHPRSDEAKWIPDHDCGKKAVLIFSIRNPDKGPGEPKRLQYPRCTAHSPQSARDHADLNGYDTKELT